MSEAPERIWTCSHLGEYGRYYPEAVEAEGEHGGTAVEYIRADHVDALEAEVTRWRKAAENGSIYTKADVDALLKAEREKALRNE